MKTFVKIAELRGHTYMYHWMLGSISGGLRIIDSIIEQPVFERRMDCSCIDWPLASASNENFN